jgi:Zn finger protein HypA/HybF involved in hydrogenase expression
MHEHSFIQAIIGNVEDPEKAKEVDIEVGELAGITADHLKEHLLEKVNWVVDTRTREARVKCSCGFEGRPNILERLHDMVIFECPECNEIPEVVEGDSIKILRVLYE